MTHADTQHVLPIISDDVEARDVIVKNTWPYTVYLVISKKKEYSKYSSIRFGEINCLCDGIMRSMTYFTNAIKL